MGGRQGKPGVAGRIVPAGVSLFGPSFRGAAGASRGSYRKRATTRTKTSGISSIR